MEKSMLTSRLRSASTCFSYMQNTKSTTRCASVQADQRPCVVSIPFIQFLYHLGSFSFAKAVLVKPGHKGRDRFCLHEHRYIMFDPCSNSLSYHFRRHPYIYTSRLSLPISTIQAGRTTILRPLYDDVWLDVLCLRSRITASKFWTCSKTTCDGFLSYVAQDS